MIKTLKLSLLLFGIAVPIFSSAQKDFGAWAGIDIRQPISKKIKFGLQLESRFENNVSEVQQSFISPYFKYDIHKHISTGLTYRYSNRPSSGLFGGDKVNRIGFDVNLKNVIPTGDLGIDVRFRYTHAWDQGDLNNDNFRTRIKLNYAIKDIVKGSDLKFHIASELFLHFNDQLVYSTTEVTSVHRFNKYRIRLGADYNFMNRHELSLFYIVQPEIEGPDTDFILGLGYKYELKRLKKKKKG